MSDSTGLAELQNVVVGLLRSVPSGVWWGLGSAAIPTVVLSAWQHGLNKENERNERLLAPSEQQLRWHIRHIRHDVALIAYLLAAILLVLIYIATLLTR